MATTTTSNTTSTTTATTPGTYITTMMLGGFVPIRVEDERGLRELLERRLREPGGASVPFEKYAILKILAPRESRDIIIYPVGEVNEIVNRLSHTAIQRFLTEVRR